MYEDVIMPEGVNSETLEHLMDPKNYGKIEDANCVGVALDEKTGEYVIFYSNLQDNIIKNASYATNGCQDTVVIGSMFSEMIIGNDTTYAQGAIQKMHEKLGKLSAQQQVCADIVFSGFVASMINFDHLAEGKEEEMHVMKMKDSCEGENQISGEQGE